MIVIVDSDALGKKEGGERGGGGRVEQDERRKSERG
jgi:hypothetical protein